MTESHKAGHLTGDQIKKFQYSAVKSGNEKGFLSSQGEHFLHTTAKAREHSKPVVLQLGFVCHQETGTPCAR